jgi:hypothetical protein
MLLSLLSPGQAIARVPEAEPASTGIVDAPLVELLTAEGTADFIVDMAEKADLSTAYSMDWDARGRFVYETLKEHADRTQAPAIKILDGMGLKHQTFFSGNLLYVFEGDLQAANAMAALPDVSLVRATQIYKLDPIVSKADIPDADFSWGIPDAKADQFWASFGLAGEGIVQANIDTGVDWTHEALQGNYKCAANPSDPACWLDPGTAECSGQDGGPCDSWNGVWHGTHVMGTQAGSNDPGLQYNVGMAPGSTWIACTGCPSGGCPDFDLNSCSDWLLAPGGDPANRPNIVNNSWGGGGGNSWYLSQVQSWYAAGIFPAFSAGNSYSCNSLGSPGDYQESFGTAAHRSDRIIADFSSKGPSAFGHEPYTKPNISAPGQDILSAMPGDGYQLMSGTSMASPHTAGAVALLWSCNPSLIGQIDNTYQILQGNTDLAPDGSCGAPDDGEGNNTYGYGYLNIYEAGLMWCGDTGILEGHVYETDGVTPISGASIHGQEVGDTGTFNATTDATGFYSLRAMVGTYDVTASKYAYLQETVTNVVITVDLTTTQDFTLDPAPSSIVSGVVTDAQTGWPLYARIDIDGYPEGPVFTDPLTGQYSVSLADGSDYIFQVNAWSGGYIQEDREILNLAGPRTENFALNVDVAACNAPGYAPDITTLEDFEISNGGYSVDPASVNSTWAWGSPTSGPGNANSGVNSWATNLAGNYLDNSDDYLVSPIIDTSLLTSGFKLDWWQWLQTESCCDPAYVQVSNDGGTTWNQVWSGQGDVDMVWAEHSVDLDASYAVPNFRVRFYLHTDSSVVFPGWYVDDVAIFGACNPMAGGFVAGNVYDDNTLLPLDKATVTADTGESALTVATPDDPNIDDGFYELFVSNELSAVHELTAYKQTYSPDTETVSVPDWDVVEQDFYLGTGHLVFTPESIDETLLMGGMVDVPGTLTNDGTGSTTYEFMEQDRGFIPTGYFEYLPGPETTGTEGAVRNGELKADAPVGRNYIFHGNAPSEAAIIVYNDDDQHPVSSVELALQELGLTYTKYGNPADPNPLDQFATEVNAGGWDLVILAQDSWLFLDAHEFTAVQNHIINGGSAMVYSWGVGYSPTQSGHGLWAEMGTQFNSWLNSPADLYWWEDSHPIFSSPQSVPEFTDLNNLGYVAYGAKMTVLGDPATGLGGFSTNPAAGEGGVILREDFKTLYRGLTDNLNSADLDTDGMLDAEEWWINAVNFMLNPAVDVDWLSVEPVSGTINAGQTIPVVVQLDAGAASVTQPGTYLATLRIKNDTPYGALQVPITMTVTPPASYGKLQGNVYSLGYCDGEMIPLAGATVMVSSASNTWTLETDDTGFYQLWLDQSNTPVTINVTYPGNETGNRTGVVITGQQTTTEDFELRWLQPCLSVLPLSLEVTQGLGEQTTEQVTITNDGAGAATWEFKERDRGYSPTKVNIPATTNPPSTRPASIGPAPEIGTPSPAQPIPAEIQKLLGAQAYALDIYPGFNMVTFDTDDPGNWTIVAPIGPSTQYFGGDFLNGDFSQMYVVDYGTNTLYTLSTTDGSVTTIGPAVPGGGESWTGLSGAPDGTLYGSATTCSSSTLYTVDPETGETVAIGPVTNAGCLIDIAANADGELYGVDIINDNLVKIDPATGAGTIVGPLGADANYAQGMDFEEESGVLYWAAYTFAGELRVIDTATGASTLIGSFPGGDEVDALAFATGGGGDIPWLYEDPTGGVIPPDGGSETADVTFDASVVTQPGKYYGTLTVSSDDPVFNKIPVVVTMTISAPATYGILEGTIQGLGHCDENPVPLEGATVIITGSSTFTLTTDAAGYYSVWLEAGAYTIEVSADGHVGQFGSATVIAQQTVTEDFALRSLEPCVSALPTTIEAWMVPGSTAVDSLSLFNAGALGTLFEIEEISGTVGLDNQNTPQASCLVALVSGSGYEQEALHETLDELGYPWLDVDTVQQARDAGAAVLMDHSPANNLNPSDIQGWMDDGFGYIEQGDWPQYFPDTWEGATAGTPLEINVVDSGHPLTRGLPSTWTGLGFWAYEWAGMNAMGYVTDPSYPNVISAGYGGNIHDNAVSYVETANDGRGVYVGFNMQGYSAGDNDKKFFENAILWTGHCVQEDVTWLAEEPITGTLEADSGENIKITLTTAPTMTLGTYIATLVVNTDDTVNGEIFIEVRLHVVSTLNYYLPIVAKHP